MTTVADVVRWLEDFAPSRLAESWDNVGLLLGRSRRAGEAGDDLPDRDQGNGPGGPRRAGQSGRQSSSGALSGDQADSVGPPRRPSRSGCWPGPAWRSPALTRRSTARRTGSTRGSAAAWGLLDTAPLRPIAPPSVVQGGRVHARVRPRGRLDRRVRRWSGADRRLHRMLVRNAPARGRFSEARTPSRRSAGAVAARRSTSCGWRWSAPGIGWRRSSPRSEAAHSYEEPAVDVVALNPPSTIGSGRIGRLADPVTLGEFARTAARIARSGRRSRWSAPWSRTSSAWPWPAARGTTSWGTPSGSAPRCC